MKRSYKNKLFSILFVMLIAGTFFLACDTENTDPPLIDNIRLIDPEMADVEITGAGLNSWLVIQGSGFATTREVYFNEYLAPFNPVLVTDNDIVIQIPEATPNIGTDSILPNTIRVLTEYGEDSYTDFIVYAPPPEIFYISNEFASAGKTITLLGQYFFLVDSVIFPGKVPAEEFYTTDDGKICSVVVPEGFTSGAIRMVSAGGTGGTIEGINFWDPTGMMCNFDDLNPWEYWGATLVNTETGSDLPPLTHQAIMAEGSGIITGSWWVQDMAIPVASGPFPDLSGVAQGNANNIFFKFEMYVEGPWNSGEYRIVLVERNATGDWLNEYPYYMKLWLDEEDESITDFETSDWITISVPLSEFGVDNFSEISGCDFFGLYFQNGGVNPGEHEIDYIKFGFDNFRMVGIPN